MRLIINIPDEQYEYIKQSDKSAFADVSSKECMLYAIKNGTPVSLEGDLISREALKKILSEPLYRSTIKDYGEVLKYTFVMDIIDNAQTVDYVFEEAFQKTVCEQKLYCPKRLKGKWKETGYETGALGITYRQTQCSNCGWEHALPMWWNFCPNCGADMRGDNDEKSSS